MTSNGEKPDSDFEREFLAALGDLVVQSNLLEDALVDLYRIFSGSGETEA